MHGFRIFFRGGGGGEGGVCRPDGQKKVWTAFFFSFLLVLNLLNSLQSVSNGFITEKTILFQGSRGGGGGSTFSRGSNFSQGGVPNTNFYRNPYKL